MIFLQSCDTFNIPLQFEHCSMAGLVLRHSGHPLHAVHGCGHADFYAWMSVTGNNYLFRTAMTNRLSFCCWCFWSHFVFRFRILNLFDISSHKTTVLSEIKPPLPSHFVLQTPKKIYPNTRQFGEERMKDYWNIQPKQPNGIQSLFISIPHDHNDLKTTVLF